MKAYWCLFLCIGIVGTVGLQDPRPALAQDADPQVERVFADWKKRQTLAKSVLYRVRGERIEPKGSWPDQIGRPSGNLPAKDIVSTSRRSVLLDFSTSRYRLEKEEELYHPGTDKLYPYVQTRVFDGIHVKSYRPRERNTHPDSGVGPTDPELGIGKGDLTRLALESVNWPLFVGHGSVPSKHRPVLLTKLTVLPDPTLFYVHGRGVHQGRPSLVLRTHSRPSGSYEEFWVDPARDSAIVRQLWYVTNKPCTDLDIAYDNPVHRWLPSKWTFTERDNGTGKTTLVERMRVEAVTLDPQVDNAAFQIQERPGMLVAHITHEPPAAPGEFPPESKEQFYRIKEEGTIQEVVIEKGVVREVPSFRWFWWLLALVPAIGLGIWLLLRRRTVTRNFAVG